MRFRTGRPVGRFFFWWLILSVAALAGAEAQAATSKTSIVDVLYRADGIPARGALLISWPAFTTSGGDAIAAGSMAVHVGTDGTVQTALFPNTGSTPQGTYYKVVVDLDDGTQSTERWVVPQVSQTTIAAVRSSLVPESQAMQFVGRDYVDSAIASVAVAVTGNQTVTGVKTFQSSPQVPTPANSGDAANRQFVLDTISSSEAAAALAQATPGTVNALQYQVNGTALASINLSDSASLAKASEIPTQTSQLTNNSGFITAAGAPVQSINGMTGAVMLTIPAAQANSDWNASTGPSLILNKPTIPGAQVNGDWNATSGVAQILNKPAIPSLAGVTSDGANGLNVTGSIAAGTLAPGKIQDWHDALGGCSPYRAEINVRDCGADPTQTTDSTAAFLAAATAACASSSGGHVTPVMIPPGNYLLTKLDLTGLSCLPLFRGVDDRAVWLVYGGAGGLGEYLIKIGYAGYGGFEGMTFLGATVPTGPLPEFGLWITGSVDNQFILRKVAFYNFIHDAIHHTNAGYVNWHMDHMRFGGVGGCAVLVTGGAGMENRPFVLDDWTLDNVYSGSVGGAAWAQANGHFDGTHWGDAPICVNNGLGMVLNISKARVELNSPQIIQGNVDNGALVREFNTASGGAATINLNGVVGYASSLHEAMISSANGRVVLNTKGGGFTANGCIKNMATQTFTGDKYCAQTQYQSYGMGTSSAGVGGLNLGSGQVAQRIESLASPESANYSLWHAGDIVLHPNSEVAPGTKGVLRYVTAPLTGRAASFVWNVTTTAVVTAGSANVTGITPGALYLQPGDNLILTGAGAAGVDLNVSVSCIDYVTGGANCAGMTGPGIQVSPTPSTSVNPATIKWQAATFHELPGAQTGSAAPTSGVWAAGEKVWNTNTASGQPIYWVCTASGTPGTWTAGPNYGGSTLSLTTTGTGGPATFNGGTGVLNIPQYATSGSVSIVEWFYPNSIGSNAFTISANHVALYDFILPSQVICNSIAVSVNTADSSANVYDAGIYDISGNLKCAWGGLAGTVIVPTTAFHDHAVSVGSGTVLAPGTYIFGFTGNAATAKFAELNGSIIVTRSSYSTISSTGGVLPSSLTPPTQTYTATQAVIWFAVHQ